MKKFVFWTAFAIILMIGCPWLTVTFAEKGGMAVSLLLFFGLNPLFSAVCGAFAGKNIKQLWPLPIITATLFIVGAWLFFELGETAFLLYSGCYLLIGIAAMFITALIKVKKSKNS